MKARRDMFCADFLSASCLPSIVADVGWSRGGVWTVQIDRTGDGGDLLTLLFDRCATESQMDAIADELYAAVEADGWEVCLPRALRIAMRSYAALVVL